eukprot:6213951-Pleurochrysis_carterae.AAC.1
MRRSARVLGACARRVRARVRRARACRDERRREGGEDGVQHDARLRAPRPRYSEERAVQTNTQRRQRETRNNSALRSGSRGTRGPDAACQNRDAARQRSCKWLWILGRSAT